MRPGLGLEGVSVRRGAFALHGVDLGVAAAEVLVVLGRNGAGKSLMLETIAGFHRPSAGRVLIAGRDVTRLPPEARRVAAAFQDFGLFPHLTVSANVALGIRHGTHVDRPARARLVAALLGRFGIAGLGGRLPHRLSPGEQQRAALARALASAPDLFLFDEPFSAIDAPTRTMLRRELRALLRETGLPTLFVTHDLADAWALADRIAIMHAGRLLQTGTLETVSQRPETRVAAELLGFDNLIPAVVISARDGIWRCAAAGHVLDAHGAGAPPEAALLCIRAGDVCLGTAEPETPMQCLDGRITAMEDHRLFLRVTLDCGFPLIASISRREARRQRLVPGGMAAAWIDTDAIRAVPADDGVSRDRGLVGGKLAG